MVVERNKVTLWYFADPMCSWCWGFSPVIQEVKERYSDKIKVALNLGGLRPGTKHSITTQEREEILHHWRSVNKMTGQPFMFENAMPEGFIYDTEPASRAIALLASLDPDKALVCFQKIQAAFYRDGKDVTNRAVLKEIVTNLAVSAKQFDDLFESPEIKQATQQHFESAHQAGIRGFPALIWQQGNKVELLCSGYLSIENLSDKIEHLLS